MSLRNGKYLYNLNTIKIISLLILLSQAALSNELKIGLEQSVPLIPQTNIAKGLYIRSANGSPFSFEISYSKDNYLFGLGHSSYPADYLQIQTATRSAAEFSSTSIFNYLITGFQYKIEGPATLLLSLNLGSENFTFNDKQNGSISKHEQSYFRADLGAKYLYNFELTKNISVYPQIGTFFVYRSSQDFNYQNVQYSTSELANSAIHLHITIGFGLSFK